jgi:hypothetical protein
LNKIVDSASHIKSSYRGSFKYYPNIPLTSNKDVRALVLREEKASNWAEYKSKLAQKQHQFVDKMKDCKISASVTDSSLFQSLVESQPSASNHTLLDVIPESMECDPSGNDLDLSEFEDQL